MKKPAVRMRPRKQGPRCPASAEKTMRQALTDHHPFPEASAPKRRRTCRAENFPWRTAEGPYAAKNGILQAEGRLLPCGPARQRLLVLMKGRYRSALVFRYETHSAACAAYSPAPSFLPYAGAKGRPAPAGLPQHGDSYGGVCATKKAGVRKTRTPAFFVKEKN